MRFAVLLSLLVFSTSATASDSEITPFSHDLLDQVLQTYVDASGGVDYPGLLKGRAPLDAYIDSLAQISPANHPQRFPTPYHGLAYWINAYNAFVLRGVIDAYPVDSVKDIALLNGFFNRVDFTAGGESLTLDHIENKIIRPQYQEPRIHFVVNCGAISCPPLGQRAYTAAKLDAQLESALELFAAAEKFVRLDRAGGQLYLSKILDWYGQDFIDWFPADRDPAPADPSLAAYLLPYLPEETAAYVRQHPDVAIGFDDYDWALNEQVK